MFARRKSHDAALSIAPLYSSRSLALKPSTKCLKASAPRTAGPGGRAPPAGARNAMAQAARQIPAVTLAAGPSAGRTIEAQVLPLVQDEPDLLQGIVPAVVPEQPFGAVKDRVRLV